MENLMFLLHVLQNSISYVSFIIEYLSDSRLYYCDNLISLVESIQTDGTDRITHFRDSTYNRQFVGIALDEKYVYLTSDKNK